VQSVSNPQPRTSGPSGTPSPIDGYGGPQT
jgi:hypothetical protein